MYNIPPYSPILSYLYPIPILPLYTLVGWTDSQNKLKESELACPPTKNHGGHSVDKSPLVGQDFFILSTLMSTEGRSAARPWTRFSSSSKVRKMAKSRNRNRARTTRAETWISRPFLVKLPAKSGQRFPGKTENQKNGNYNVFTMRDPPQAVIP